MNKVNFGSYYHFIISKPSQSKTYKAAHTEAKKKLKADPPSTAEKVQDYLRNQASNHELPTDSFYIVKKGKKNIFWVSGREYQAYKEGNLSMPTKIKLDQSVLPEDQLKSSPIKSASGKCTDIFIQKVN